MRAGATTMHYTPRIMELPDTIAIVGVGLLGGSIAAAAKSRKPTAHVVGIGRNHKRLAQAASLGLLDSFHTDVSGVAQADTIVVCTPVDRISEDVRATAAVAKPGAVITDVGSVKGTIVSELADLAAAGTFVGSHPMAGSEKTGFEHADAGLFVGAKCVICATDETPSESINSIAGFWGSLGAVVAHLSADEHDRIVAAISHLPHAVAVALAMTPTEDALPFAATGFADTTRIAKGNADLWTAILTANRAALLASIDQFETRLGALRAAVESDPAAIRQLLAAAATRPGP